MNIAIPAYAAPDSFADNVAFTLQAMGHEVLTIPHRPRFLARSRALYQRARRSFGPEYFDPRERWLIHIARKQRVDMVLALTQCLRGEALREARRFGLRYCVAWWADAPANLTSAGWGLLSSEWDLICLKDPQGVSKFRRVGLNAHLLHEAMNPAWHKPVAQQKNGTVVVAGNYYGYRQFLLRKLEQAGVATQLYGSAIPRWGLPELRARHSGRYVVREEKSQIFGEALACLNSTSLSEGNSLNCRAFEVAGAGGLQLIETNPILAECFDPGRELLVFDTFDELLVHIDRAHQFPEEMRAIRGAGARRALAHHTYRHRLQAMFNWIASA
jgi:spore maturation protein CgeB